MPDNSIAVPLEADCYLAFVLGNSQINSPFAIGSHGRVEVDRAQRDTARSAVLLLQL